MDKLVAEALVRDAYARLHDAWFGKQTNWPLAELKFIYRPGHYDPHAIREFDWGYDYALHRMQCVLYEGQLVADDGMKPHMDDRMGDEPEDALYRTDRITGWAYWRWNLVHELCHEYEHRVLKGESSPEGESLLASKIRPFNWPPPEKHLAPFYSAVHCFAARFGLDPTVVVKEV